MKRLFLLSPAKVGGIRATMLLNPQAAFPLARQFRREGLPLGEVFAFMSALYFRGKLAYARRFADPAAGDLIRVITSDRGLVSPEQRITVEDLRAFGTTDIDPREPRYQRPLTRDVRALAAELAADGQAILLGSVATGKYRETLVEGFGVRLHFPADFVGRGDMSRGGLLLRASRGGTELPYIPVLGASYRGKRPPKLERLK